MKPNSLHLLAVATLALVTVCPVLADEPVAPAYQKIQAIVDSGQMTREQKIAALRGFIPVPETRLAALWQLNTLDPEEATRAALALFRAKDSPMDLKLNLGRFLLGDNRAPQKPPDGFAREYAALLIRSILDTGEKEFLRAVPVDELTAVGEYAYLASDFEGYKGIDFAPFKDPRLIDVLVRCLDAPDNTWPTNPQGCIQGQAGKSTGRNTARQQIPIALAKLDAVQAVEPLRRTLRDHADWYERDNAAYALAILEPITEHAALIAELRAAKVLNEQGKPDFARDRYFHLYAFGRGRLTRGDDAGLEFLAPEYSIYSLDKGLSETVYMLDQRLHDVEKVQSPRLEAFFLKLFADEKILALFLLNKDKVTFNDYGHAVYDFTAAVPRLHALFDTTCKVIEKNRLSALRPTVERVARDSADSDIRARAAQCLKSFAK